MTMKRMFMRGKSNDEIMEQMLRCKDIMCKECPHYIYCDWWLKEEREKVKP
jgi:hypothetical protein